MNFKSPRIEQEWQSAAIHPRLHQLLLFLEDQFTERGLALTVTCLLRTREEQLDLYPHNPDPPTSVHELGRGADIRTIGLPRNLIGGMVDLINRQFPYDPARPAKKSALFHDVGAGEHIHLQVTDAADWPVITTEHA